MTTPQTFNQVIGNVAAIDRIKSAIAENNGLGGCVFFLHGETGNGKTMLADIIADIADGDVYRPNCNDDAESERMMEAIKTHAKTSAIWGGLSVFIFDECDRLSVENVSNFKTAFDTIHREKTAGKTPPVVVIFTTAQTKDTVNPTFRKHWDEFVTRCVFCKVGVTRDELNEHFAKVTDGAVTNIGWKIKVQSVRAAWEYVKANNLPIIDVIPAPEPFVLPEPVVNRKTVEFVQTGVPVRKAGAPKPQQNLIGIIRDVIVSIGEPVSYSDVRRVLDESGTYVFKKGVEGWRRTNQIVSAVHNHVKKYGESALLCKTADGKIAVRN